MSNPFDKFVAPETGGSSFYEGVRALLTPLKGRITSTNGGKHNTGSLHYSGRALDVGMARESPEQQEAIKAQLEAAGYRVRDERKRPAGQAVWSGPHLHVSRSDGEPAPRLQLADALGGGSGGGGGTGAMPVIAAAPSSNAFDQFDSAPAPSAAAALGGANPFDAFDAPDFSDVQTASGSTEPVGGLPVLPSSAVMSGNGDIPLRAEDREVGAIYTDKRGEPRRWLGDGWGAGDSARETTLGEFAGGAGIDLVQGLTRAPEALADLAGWLGGGESLLTPTGKQGFEDARQSLEQFKPEAYRAEQAVPIVQRDAQGGVDGIGIPSGESVLGMIAQSLPQIPQMIATGGGLKTAAQGILPNAPKLASVLGYGTSNAGMVAPGIAEQARTEALAAGATPEDAQDAANKAMAMAVPLTMATGGVGEGLAGAQGAGAKSLISALLRGAATEAPAESIEEAGTSAIGDIAQGRDVNAANALESGIMAAFGGGIPGAAVAGTEYTTNRGQPAAFPADGINIADLVAAMTQPTLPAVAAEGTASPRQGDAPAAPPTSPAVEKPEVATDSGAIATPSAAIAAAAPAAARPDMAAATRSIDDRLAALDDTAAGQIDEAEVSALNTERQELDDLLREQDRAKREGLIQSPESRLSPEERATADARRTEIAATLERHRAARTAADQAQRLRTRLENTDSDAGLFDVAREINPTLGTPQADAFRGPTSTVEKIDTAPDPVRSADLGNTPNVTNVADLATQAEPNVGDLPRASAASATPASAQSNTPVSRNGNSTPESFAPASPDIGIPRAASSTAETGIPVSPRAESQREPAQSGQQNIPENIPERQTSLKNAVTDAERVAEGRDPIIREARKGNRETVDEAVRAIRKTPSIGRETAARLAEGGPVELKDEAVLLVHKVDLRKRRDAAAERAQSPNVSEEARAIARREYDDAVQQIDEVDQAASRIGTESGRLLQLRKRMIAEDYSMPALERKLRMVVNRDLKPAEKAEIKELSDKVATLQRKLDAVESQQASAQVAEMLARLMKQAPGKNATLAERRAAAMESKAALSAMSSTRAPQRSIPEDRPATARSGAEAFRGMTREQFLGKPRITRNTNAADLRPSTSNSLEDAVAEPFLDGRYTAKIDDIAAAVFDGEKVIASYDKWATLVVDKKYRNQGIGAELVYQFRTRNPGMKPATDRTKAAQALQEKVWSRIQRELSAADSERWSRPENAGKPGQARAALTDRLGRGVVARLERAGVLEFDERSGGTWDGTRIGIGNISPENALGVLLHEVTHANMLDVLGEQGYERALRDLDALEAAGDPLALKAKRRAAKSGETGQRLDDERIAYMVEEATNAAAPAPKVTEFLRSVFSAFRRWAATSAVFRALEKIGVDRPTLKPADFAAFARKGLDRMVADAKNPESAGLRGKVRELENQLRTDTMTGMKNRRAFDEDEALGWPTVAAIDMDGLGKLNEGVGHEAADKVLKALADTFMAAENDSIRVYRHTGGDELAVRFKNAADADRVMADLQRQLDGMNVEMDVAGADGVTRSFTYEGIGITYGTGATYEQADAVAVRRKIEREEAGLRQSKQDPRPSRRLREDSPRPGGRREGDPPAVGAQRSVPDQTQTPAFRRWFGDSKVVDANGDPLVVYRGGATANWRDGSDITEFQSTNGPWAGFFTSSPETASRFASAQYAMSVRGGAPAGVFPVYLNIRKPLEVDAKGRPARDFQIDASTVEQPDSPLREKLLGGDYDGLILRNTSDEGDVFVAMRPEQIKSATANRGTFDPADPNIMRSIPEGEDAAPAGADPVAFFHLARMGAFHYADGARTEAEWTKRMEADLGTAADRYRSMLPDAFKASKAQADRVAKGPETVAEAVEAIGEQRRPRDVKRVVRAVVAEGMRGEDAIISATAQALDMDDADVRTLFVQSESKAQTLTEAQAELKELRLALKRENARPAKEAKQALRRDQKEMREAQREALRPDEETQYQAQRARDFQRRIAELEERIASGDFTKPEKTEHDLVERNKRLQFELEKTKERFHKYALEAEFQSRTPIGKIFGETVAGINFARAIMTSLDLSAILRQGGKISFGHPLRALKAVPGSLKAFVSEDADFRARQDIENRRNAPLYKKFGLELTSIGGDALSRTEEAYASRWVDKLPTAAGGGLIRGSGRSYTAFLNRLRADSFDAMLAALARDGSNPTKEEGKAIANYINVATGRGKVGKNEKSGEVLNTVFFAPRLVASRFQLLAGQPLYGGSNRTRKMIAMEYARFLIGVSVATGLAMLMRDEDDETKPIEIDPRSANFGKVRFGDTFLDPLAGLAQVTVFLARVLSGETRTTTSDKLKPLRDEYRLTDVAPGLGDGYELGKTGYGGRDVPDVIASFLRSKLAPVPGAILNVATGENMIGEKVTPGSAAGELVTPMSVGNLVDVLESQGMARGTAINLLGILGMSVQYRKSDAEKAAEDENGIPGALGFGTADMSSDN
ncbi:MAG: diguanylate cyclase [Pseudomonadota bacterium]